MTRDQTQASCTRNAVSSHCITREAPIVQIVWPLRLLCPPAPSPTVIFICSLWRVLRVRHGLGMPPWSAWAAVPPPQTGTLCTNVSLAPFWSLFGCGEGSGVSSQEGSDSHPEGPTLRTSSQIITSPQGVCGKVTESCPNLCDPMDCSPPGSSVHGILQARVLKCITIPLSRGSLQPRNQTQGSCIARKFIS